MKPKVSAIIPCYNDGAYIEKAVASVLGSDVDIFELIVVDDGSDQLTKSHLNKIQTEKVKIIHQENKGVSAARNKGIAEAEGEYILLLDADDKFAPSFLGKAIQILENNADAGAVSCWYNIVENEKVIKQAKPKGGKIEDFMFTNSSMVSSLLRKKCWEDAGRFDESMLAGYEDWEFWISVTKKGWEVRIIEEYLYDYFNKPGSRNKKAAKQDLEIKAYIFKKHKDLYVGRYSDLLEYFNRALELKEREKQRLRSTIDFKLGASILRPLRFLKRIF
ncbi:glycosyltransferase [Leptobacterium flavescens]|uniref:Glycosyltransferase n=1 Tax=Leptobacterium flavescens TaxID=472055 RepID=A0A6P0UMA9_9FLAO|nr:glycosyltransferase family A protein [Leptobacterium flavescens]NER12183.1 glycosyltransferase [Leptobacterium flavescens]